MTAARSREIVAHVRGLSPTTFLRDDWQKRPRLFRQALPGFSGILERDTLLSLATRTDAISRLVLHYPKRKQQWERHDGPFGGLDVSMLPKSHWSVLVHGVESLVPGGWELLRNFSFIPSARIDDLMVSYATDGGTVGAHDDAYDVFLLQGPGRRRWQISSRRHEKSEFDSDAAIRVIKDFVPDQEWILEPGDMLYLPPGVAHRGVALGPCFTYSIGFLAPSHSDVIQNFLGYLGAALEEKLDPERLFEDPDLKLQANPLAISDAMMKQMSQIVRTIRWDESNLEEFVGRFLTGPKAHTRFAAPKRPMSHAELAKRLARRGTLALALPSRGLVRPGRIFFNGEAHRLKSSTQRLFEQLVRERALVLPLARPLDDAFVELIYGWYVDGYLSCLT